jgi:D-alanine--poly(phosphoribitol) ligase subunit 1
LTFDVSVQSFLAPLLRGSCTYTIPFGEIKYSYAFNLLDEQKLTFGVLVPSMVRYLRPYFQEIDLQHMKYNILTAEGSPVELVQEWSRCVPNAEIYNFYGPTETTIYCTCYKFERNGENKHLNGILAIGKPLKGIKAIVLDENDEIVMNRKGELCISGAQVTLGYMKNPIKNSESFIERKIEGKRHRFYRTGDLCCMDESGDITYSGRMDSQIKLQGYRIELGEIEFHARAALNGKNTAVISFTNSQGQTELAMFVEGDVFDTRMLTEYLNGRLPRYSVPGKIIFRQKMPLNANGKIDRKSLNELIEHEK